MKIDVSGFEDVPVFDDNATAIAGGLEVGDIYQGTGRDAQQGSLYIVYTPE